jgi:hypothetical protein
LTFLNNYFNIVIMEINRNIFEELCDDLSDRRPTLLVGARQTGKTFLLRKLEDYARNRGLSTSFFDLEQPEHSARFALPAGQIVEDLKDGAEAVFIDEFHYLENASGILKAVHDSGAAVKVYASGSSALEIHRHLKESLAGRKIIRRLFPCGFFEMTSSVPASLDRYLTFGGMPGLVNLGSDGERQRLLADIVQSYVLKDIKSLIREENIRAFNSLVYLLAERQGNLISASSLAGDVGLSSPTIESHLEILSQTYVSIPVHSYSNNLGNELRKSRKIYLYDQGIRNSLLKDFRPPRERPDGGAVFEGYVAGELSSRLGPSSELRFWRTRAGEEVDFVWVENRVPWPIEVKAGDVAGSLPRGLRAFLRRYPATRKAFVLHGGPEATVDVDGVTIRYLPLERAWHLPDEVPR